MNILLFLELEIIKFFLKGNKRVENLILISTNLLFKKSIKVETDLIKIKIHNSKFVKDPFSLFMLFYAKFNKF